MREVIAASAVTTIVFASMLPTASFAALPMIPSGSWLSRVRP